MSAIRSKDTRPERLLRSAVFARGLRFRLHVRGLPGSPDLVFPRYQAAVFVHGCFWHRHPRCRFTTDPSSNVLFWQQKFMDNVRRDAAVAKNLRELGWRVGIVWECAIKSSAHCAAQSLHEWLTLGGESEVEIGAPNSQ
jgi:DNA mismatch endonuclease (patch repair protein)